MLVSPSQQTTPIATSDQRATLGPLLETGLWTVRPATETDDQGAARAPDTSTGATLEDTHTINIACNLAAAVESDLRPRAELTDIGSLRLLALGGRSLWFYLTLLAAGLIVTEWWLYQRRIVG